MFKNLRLNRRQALWFGLTTLAGMGTIGGHKFSSLAQQIAAVSSSTNFTAVGTNSLRQRAAAKGLIYGAAVRHKSLASNPTFNKSFANECGVLVPEWDLKWATLRPDINSFDFTYADWLANYARNQKMLFRGHTLVWHDSLPAWFGQKVNQSNAKQVLLKHIETVVRRYAGQIHSWDVVNEAINIKDGRSDGLRNTPWLKLLGPDYIEIAFRAAAKADPKALLVYNDYGLDVDYWEDEAKRSAVLKLLERLKSKGTPIHALGIQAHMEARTTRFNPSRLVEFVRRVAKLGLKVMITEMDVRDTNLPNDPVIRANAVAYVYKDYLSAVLKEPSVIGVMTWGLSDRYTWLAEDGQPLTGAPVKPLPLDYDFKRKSAWYAIASALDQAPKR